MFWFYLQVRKVRKVLKADDILDIDAQSKPTPDGVINQKDIGSRKSKRKSEGVSGVVLKSEPVDMEIDLEIDDLPPRKIFYYKFNTLNLCYVSL